MSLFVLHIPHSLAVTQKSVVSCIYLFFEPLLRQKKWEDWPNILVKWLQMLVNRMFAIQLEGKTTIHSGYVTNPTSLSLERDACTKKKKQFNPPKPILKLATQAYTNSTDAQSCPQIRVLGWPLIGAIIFIQLTQIMKNINQMSYAYTQTQDNFPYPTHNIYQCKEDHCSWRCNLCSCIK